MTFGVFTGADPGFLEMGFADGLDFRLYHGSD